MKGKLRESTSVGVYMRKGSHSNHNDQEFKDKANKLISLYVKGAIDRDLLENLMSDLNDDFEIK